MKIIIYNEKPTDDLLSWFDHVRNKATICHYEKCNSKNIFDKKIKYTSIYLVGHWEILEIIKLFEDKEQFIRFVHLELNPHSVFLCNNSPVKFSGKVFLPLSNLRANHGFTKILKRSFDICGALLGLLISLPCVVILGVIITIESPGNIFYTQIRTGLNNKKFKIFKFRTMKLDAEADGVGWSTKDDPRQLKIGKILRRLNIDEFPQFLNVLVGQMSLVGPRPERPELIEKFCQKHKYYQIRTLVKPGMTGLAQVNGYRGDTCLQTRVLYDLCYIRNYSLLQDIKIILNTIF